jgi:hypothetical protein
MNPAWQIPLYVFGIVLIAAGVYGLLGLAGLSIVAGLTLICFMLTL